MKHVVTDSATVPRLAEVTLDARVIVFASGLTLLAALLAGLVPAFAATRLALVESLKDGLRGSTGVAGARLRPLLVGLEVALAVVLVAGAGLLIRSLAQVLDVKPGFSIDGVQTLSLSLSATRTPVRSRATRFYRRRHRTFAALPGVSAVGADQLPAHDGTGLRDELRRHRQAETAARPGAGGGRPHRATATTSARWGSRCCRAAHFGPGDTGDRAHVVIISQALADESFPHENPHRPRNPSSTGTRPSPDRIIGVVGNVRHENLETARSSHDVLAVWAVCERVHDRYRQNQSSRRRGLLPRLARVVRDLDPSVPVGQVRPMRDVLGETLATRTLVMSLLSLFAGLALVLAALGIYAVTTAAVAERRAELAIRVALGAQPIRVAGLVLRQALTSAAGGAIAGLVAALVLGRFVESMLFDVRPFDPWALAGTVAALVVVAGLASLAPGRAATKVDPMDALKSE